MTTDHLKGEMLAMVRKHGFEQVHECLHAIRAAEPTTGPKLRPRISSSGSLHNRKSIRKPKPTAPQYVAKMELPLEKEPSVAELAERFHKKSFLPSFGDIANFCQIYSIDVPASRTRANAIPRVFKCIAIWKLTTFRELLTRVCSPALHAWGQSRTRYGETAGPTLPLCRRTVTFNIMDVKNPITPGEILLEEYLKPMGISQNAMARAIGVAPRAINEIVHGRRSIAPAMSIRFGAFFGQSEQFWHGLQAECDFRELNREKQSLTAGIQPASTLWQAS